MITTDSMRAITLDSPMQITVRELCQKYEELWWSCNSELPDLGAIYTLKDKLTRESHLSKSIDHLFGELEHFSNLPDERQQAEDRILFLATNFAKTAFNIEDRHIFAVFSTGIIDATRDFIRQARRFDPFISFHNIYQASRNAWTMNLLQLLFNIPVAVTSAVLAYSLLYPYTDNYLDDPRITPESKMEFNHRLRQRLEGEQVSSGNRAEQKIFDLVGLIESQYERWQYSEVYESLLAIYRAQTKSIKLLNSKSSPYELDILGLTFEKGGTSVLADGYLVAGTLTPIQRELAFHYGSFTQLMDDLEDIEDDRSTGMMTIFSQTANRWPLDLVTNRAFNYGYKMLEKMEELNTPGLGSLMELMHLAITPLLIDSISQAGKFYTRSYLRTLEAHFPFRFSYLRKQRRRINKKMNNNRRLWENLLQAAG